MILSHKHKFIFIHVPKTAGVSVQKALSADLGPWINRRLHPAFGYVGEAPGDSIEPTEYHVTAVTVKKWLCNDPYGSSIFNRYFKFGFVRNPWDRMVSLYAYMCLSEEYARHHPDKAKVMRGMTFDQWVRDCYQFRSCTFEARPQVDWLFGDSGTQLVDYVGRFEELDQGIQTVARRLGLALTLNHENKTPHRPYMDYYTDETRDMVATMFRPDIEAYGYTFEGGLGPSTPVVKTPGDIRRGLLEPSDAGVTIPTDLEQALEEGLEQHRNGQLDRAKAIYQGILQKRAEHPEALHYLGLVAYQQGRLNEAAELIEHSLRVSEPTVARCNDLGEVCAASRNYEQAIGHYDRAIQIDPCFADAHYNRARVLQLMGRDREAIPAYQNALQLRPDMIEAHNNLGLVYTRQEMPDEAIACFDRAIQLDPSYADAHNNLGITYLNRQDYRAAEAAFTHALKINPKLTEARENIRVIGAVRKGMRVCMYVNYYLDNDPDRQKEIEACLGKNVDNTLIDQVYVIVDNASLPRLLVLVDQWHPKVSPVVLDRRPTFNDYFSVAELSSTETDIHIIANSDIFLDERSVESLIGADLEGKVFALSCWDVQSDGSAVHRDQAWTQDTWIWQGVPKRIDADFYPGTMACDNRVAHAFASAGYGLVNPSKTIKTYHLHVSEVRNYSRGDKIRPPYVWIEPTELEARPDA